jgi:hypothetical protein
LTALKLPYMQLTLLRILPLEATAVALYFLHVIPPKMPAAQSSGYFGAVPIDYQKEIRQKAYEWFDRISAKVPKKTIYI